MEGLTKLHIKMINKNIKKRHHIQLRSIEQLWDLASKQTSRPKEELAMTYEDLEGDEIDLVGQEDVDTLLADMALVESAIKTVKVYVRGKGEEVKRKRGHLDTAWVMDANTGRRVKYFSNSFERGKFVERMEQKDYREVIKRKKVEGRLQAKYEILRNQIEKDAERQRRILERELQKKLKALEEKEKGQKESLQRMVERVGERPGRSNDNRGRVKRPLLGLCLVAKGRSKREKVEKVEEGEEGEKGEAKEGEKGEGLLIEERELQRKEGKGEQRKEGEERAEGVLSERADIEERRREEKRAALRKSMPGVSEEIIGKVVRRHGDGPLGELQALVMDEIMNKMKALQRGRPGCGAAGEQGDE